MGAIIAAVGVTIYAAITAALCRACYAAGKRNGRDESNAKWSALEAPEVRARREALAMLEREAATHRALVAKHASDPWGRETVASSNRRLAEIVATAEKLTDADR